MAKIHFRNRFHKYCKILRALIARVILVAHGAVAVVLTAHYNKYFYFLLGLLVILFCVETAVVLYFRSGCEWKRFCTCFLCYLLTIVPCLWLQRLDIYREQPTTVNKTMSSQPDARPLPLLGLLPSLNGSHSDTPIIKVLSNVDTPSFIEQSMMFVIILVRWLLPRGFIDRNSLSQLLIMYCAIGADILDFSEIFDKIPKDAESNFRYIVLGVWSWSLLQFTLVITTSFSFKDREQVRQSVAHLDVEIRASVEDNENKSELMSLLMVFFMQDGPFLATRCFTIFFIGVQDYLIIFFALKNIMTLVLGMFRILVLCGFIANDGNDILILEKAVSPTRRMHDIEMGSPTKKKKVKSGKVKKKCDKK